MTLACLNVRYCLQQHLYTWWYTYFMNARPLNIITYITCRRNQITLKRACMADTDREKKKKLSANDCHSHNWSHNVSVFVEFCRLGQSPSSQKRIMGPKCANWWWFSSSHLQNVEENFSRSQPPCFLISSSSSSNLSPRLSCHRWIWLDPRGTENIWWRGLAPHKGWCKNLDPMIQKFHEIPSISWGSVEPSNSWAADSRMITAKHHDLQGIRLRTPCSLDLLPASGKM